MANKQILTIDIKRTGLRTVMRLRGDIDFSMLKDATGEQFRVGTVLCNYWNGSVKLTNVALNQSGSNFDIWHTPLNLSILQAVGLREGIELEITVPVRTDALKRLAGILKDAAKELYLNFVRPVDIEVEVFANEKEALP